jgi:hypothetical protein
MSASVAVLLALSAQAALPAQSPRLVRVGPTEKIAQLTGDFDRARGEPTRSLTHTRAGVLATDLGSSFLHKGRLVFLFGDTWGWAHERDTIAFADPAPAEQLELDFLKADDGTYLPIHVPGIDLGAFCVPSYGISLNGRIYVAFTTNVAGRIMSRSVLIRSDDDGRTWEPLYDLARDDPDTPNFEGRFVNVAFARDADDTLWMWGSGEYRKSHLHLARIRPDAIEDVTAWRYFAGSTTDGEPLWSTDQSAAAPLFEHPVIGELSCAWIPSLERWILLYNSADPRGIVLRESPSPTGPWSEPIILFDPWADGGYGVFMHVPHDFRRLDDVHDPGRENDWGGEYGPYLIPALSTGTPDRTEIVFTMSVWNPYQVVLMRGIVGLCRQEEPAARPAIQVP